MSDLNLDALQSMKKSDFLKSFKNKAIWKKANAVIVLVDYLLDGKKIVVALPYKKVTDMKADMKRIKKDKLHIVKKSGGGTINFEKQTDGTMSANIELQVGGLDMKTLQTKGQKLFNIIKVQIAALQSAEAAAEAAATESEVGLDDDSEEDEDYGEAMEDDLDENIPVTMTAAEREQKVADLKKINENLDKILSKVLNN